ncbi:hypothetical protein D0T26_16820 [Duganella sp. BJB489]|nr:hypothetical protein D0T26_16820 [Duganella sp. BJB489]
MLGSARRAFGSSEQAAIADGLGGLDLIGKQLASRAADFVANGGDPAVLLELARRRRPRTATGWSTCGSAWKTRRSPPACT